MIYLLYEDATGWKVARSDGHLDEFTRYYSSRHEAATELGRKDIRFWLSETIEQQPQEIVIL